MLESAPRVLKNGAVTELLQRMLLTYDVSDARMKDLYETLEDKDFFIESIRQSRVTDDTFSLIHSLHKIGPVRAAEIVGQEVAAAAVEAQSDKDTATKEREAADKAARALRVAASELMRDPDIPMYVKERIQAHLKQLL